MVLRVDKEKGYIDLSKRCVCHGRSSWGASFLTCAAPPPQASGARGRERVRGKIQQEQDGALHHAACSGDDWERSDGAFCPPERFPQRRKWPDTRCDSRSQELYEQLGWPLYKRHGHAFDAFKLLAQDPVTALLPFTPEEAPVVTPAVRAALMVNIRRRMTPLPLKIRADVELTCFAYDGVLHIKDAMRVAQAASKDSECVVNMKLVAPPLYVLTTQTLDKEAGIKLLEEAIAAASACIDGHKGRLLVKEGARAVSERDEKLLAEKLDKLAAANEEVDGDEEDEEDETMGTADFDAPPMPTEGGAAAPPAAQEPRAAKAAALAAQNSDGDED